MKWRIGAINPEATDRVAAVLNQMHQEIKKPLPEVQVFVDPSRRVLIGRSPFGKGLVLLSQGWVATARESELRALLSAVAMRARKTCLSFCREVNPENYE